jgi:hypothetical protein
VNYMYIATIWCQTENTTLLLSLRIVIENRIANVSDASYFVLRTLDILWTISPTRRSAPYPSCGITYPIIGQPKGQ